MCKLRSFQYDGDALPSSYARRPNAEVDRRIALEFVRQVRRDPRSARAQGMSDRDGPSVDVRLAHVQIQFPLAGQELRRKGLVDFEPIDVFQGLSRLGQGSSYGGDGSDSHDGRVASHRRVTDQSAQRRQAALPDRAFRRQDDGTGAVANPAGRSGRHDAAEGRSETGQLVESRAGTGMLVRVHDGRTLASGNFDGSHFEVEEPSVLGSFPSLLRSQGEGVAVLHAHTYFCHDIIITA